MSNRPLISVVTVVRNRENVIERCIESVLGQSFTNFEYLIKDGNSTDTTVEIVSKYHKKLAHFETSPDKNLYDAMNIAASHAKGEWIYYLQSDDQLLNADVFAKVAPYLENTTADVVYGTALMKFDWEVTKTLKAHPISSMWRHMPFCHQAMFQRVKLAQQYPFDLSMLPAADYDQVYKLYSLGYKFETMPVTVAILDAGGMSDAKRIEGLKKVGQIKRRYDSNAYHHMLHSLYTAKSAFNLKLKQLLPTAIVKRIFKIRQALTEK